jgi:hypothetical protein
MNITIYNTPFACARFFKIFTSSPENTVPSLSFSILSRLTLLTSLSTFLVSHHVQQFAIQPAPIAAAQIPNDVLYPLYAKRD